MNTEFWKGKKVLITGHTGFKGSWLSLWLQKMGADLVGYSLLPPTSPSLFEEASVVTGMRSIIGDVRDLEKIKHVMQEEQPEIIFHLAAQALVRPSYENPVETYSTNVMGTVNVLEAIRLLSCVKSAVIITSDKCYENREWVWSYRENDAMGGYDPYSNSKSCAELVTSSFRQSFFNKEDGVASVASVRAGNVIGGGDWAEDRLIPDMMRAITEKRPVLIRSPHAIRPWQHVLEPLSGYLLLAEKLYESGSDWAEGWNFGPNDSDAKPVQWIVDQFTQLWGEDASWILDETVHPHEAHYLKLDCSKAGMRLDWQPQWSLSYTLESIAAWHKAYQNNQDMHYFSLNQIEKFQENSIK